ncbi:MAG: NADH-quinone oxidoreductase subunit H, partial [Desulfurococcaceae archaeon]
SQLVNPLWSIITLFPVTTAMLISGYALTGRAPFDISEAEPELASGTLIEFSGYLLALYIYSSLLKKFSAKLFIAVLITSSVIDGGIPGLITAYALTLVIWIAFSVISSTLGRSRVDLAPRALTKVYIALLAISITGLLVFAYV